MLAPEQPNRRAQRLRRAVAELADCSIDDIESIWGALTETERAQLRPVLADMPVLTPNGLDAIETADSQRVPSAAGDKDSTCTAERLNQIAPSLPPPLTSRLLDCVDHRTRSAAVEALPLDYRALLISVERPYTITKTARQALREAALTVIGSMDDFPQPSPGRPATFAQKIRRLLGRQA